MNTNNKFEQITQFEPETIAPGLQKKIDLFYSLKNDFLSLDSEVKIVNDFFKSISVVLNKASLTYTMCGIDLPKVNIPRNSSMVCGPSFVSEKYPQPIDSKGCEMFPVLQIDLEWLGQVTDKKFRREIFQFWWSSKDAKGVIRIIPKHEIILSESLPLILKDEVFRSVEDWIPYDWLCEDRGSAYLITGCDGIGITYPSFDHLLEYYVELGVGEYLSDDAINLIGRICSDDEFNAPKKDSKNILFNIFGRYRSHSCGPWESDSQVCFLHTNDWSCGMMDANIFARIDAEGIFGNFVFGFGR